MSVLLLGLAGLPGYIHDEGDRTPKAVPDKTTIPRELAEYQLVMDIGRAQFAERDKCPGMGPEDSISYLYVLSATDHRNYRFANVHALRRDIKHRLGSLKAAGSAFKYDTTCQEPLHRDSTAVFIPQ